MVWLVVNLRDEPDAGKPHVRICEGKSQKWLRYSANMGGVGLDPETSETECTQTGAEEMLALCALYQSEDGRWQRHWEQRGKPIRWK